MPIQPFRKSYFMTGKSDQFLLSLCCEIKSSLFIGSITNLKKVFIYS